MMNECINFSEGLRRLMNNKGLYKKLLLSQQSGGNNEVLIELIKAGEHEKIIRMAHTLKGAALNLSLTQIGAVAEDIEQRAKEGKSAEDLIDKLRQATEGTTKAIQDLIESGQL